MGGGKTGSSGRYPVKHRFKSRPQQVACGGTKELNNSMTKTSERGTGNCICRLRGFLYCESCVNSLVSNFFSVKRFGMEVKMLICKAQYWRRRQVHQYEMDEIQN